jgi:hypothetical protein
VRPTRFFISHNQEIGKTNNLKVFGSKYNKRPKHDSQNWLKSPVTMKIPEISVKFTKIFYLHEFTIEGYKQRNEITGFFIST